MKWWDTIKKEDGKEEVELPPAIKEQLEQAKQANEKVTRLETSFTEFINSEKERRAREDEERNKKNRPAPKIESADDIKTRNEQAAALLLEGRSDEAYALMAAKTNAGLLQIAAKQAKSEVFGENPEDYPYYHGDIKKEIDSILAEQALEHQSNPNLIKNTYYTVVGKHHNDISEGKIKSRFAQPTGGAKGSGTDDRQDDGRPKITVITDDIKRAAQLTGLKPEDYIEMLNKDVEAYI